MKRPCLWMVALCCAAAPVAAACGSSSSGGVAPAVVADAGTDATTPGTAVHGTDACAAAIRFDVRCGQTDAGTSTACADDRSKGCGMFAATVSEAYSQALLACYTDTTTCGASRACADDRLGMATPTAMQTKVRDDYCSTCNTEAGPNCARDYFQVNSNGVGAGYLILQLSDQVLGTVDKKCTGVALDPVAAARQGASCRDLFTACAITVAQSALPALPDSCRPPPMGDAGMPTEMPMPMPADAAAN